MLDLPLKEFNKYDFKSSSLSCPGPAVLEGYATHQPSQQCHTEYKTDCSTSYARECPSFFEKDCSTSYKQERFTSDEQQGSTSYAQQEWRATLPSGSWGELLTGPQAELHGLHVYKQVVCTKNLMLTAGY